MMVGARERNLGHLSRIRWSIASVALFVIAGIVFANGLAGLRAAGSAHGWAVAHVATAGALAAAAIVLPAVLKWSLVRQAQGGAARCLHCGRRRDAGAPFCPSCGWRTESEQWQADRPKEPWQHEW